MKSLGAFDFYSFSSLSFFIDFSAQLLLFELGMHEVVSKVSRA